MSTVGSVLAALTTLAQSTLPGTLPAGWLGDAWQVINGGWASVTTRTDLMALIGSEPIVGEQASVDVPGESYIVPVTFSASLPTTDQQVADDFAMDAYEAYAAAVRNYPGKPALGVTGLMQAFPTGDFRVERLATAEVRNAVVRFDIRAIAHTV